MSLESITLIGKYYVSEINGTCQEGDAVVLGHQYNPVANTHRLHRVWRIESAMAFVKANTITK